MDEALILRGGLIVAALAAATMLTRFLPFILFPQGKKIPDYVEYLGKTLPYATIGLLVVYCLKDVDVWSGSHGLPEIIAVAVIVVLHWWRGNSLLSIGAGTVLYMALVQAVFV